MAAAKPKNNFLNVEEVTGSVNCSTLYSIYITNIIIRYCLPTVDGELLDEFDGTKSYLFELKLAEPAVNVVSLKV